MYYGLTGLVNYKNRDDLPYIRELTAWAIKYRFKQTCDAALIGFRNMPDKENLSLIYAVWKEFSRRPYEGDELPAYEVSRVLCTHRYPETVPLLAPFLEYDFGRSTVQQTLRKIVGRDLGDRPQAWLDWYKREGVKTRP